MPEQAFPTRWTGRQAVMTLPDHINRSNVDQIRSQLLRIINRDAAVLIVDMTGTMSCDYYGADALVRAYGRAVANGTELRLVVVAEVVRRVLSLSGLDRLVSVYPALDGALAAASGQLAVHGGQAPAAAAAGAADDRRARPASTEGADQGEELLDSVINSIFHAGMILQDAAGLSAPPAAQRIIEALGCLDGIVRDIRDRAVTRSARTRGTVAEQERSAPSAQHPLELQERLAQTASSLHRTAADTVARLERQAQLRQPPTRFDYPAEIKRWRTLARQADQIATRWTQR